MTRATLTKAMCNGARCHRGNASRNDRHARRQSAQDAKQTREVRR